MRKSWLLIALLLASVPANAQLPPTKDLLYGDPLDARSLALGGASFATQPGPLALSLHPARLSEARSYAFAFTPRTERRLEDYDFEHYALLLPVPGLESFRPAVLVDVRRQHSEMIVRTAFDPTGTLFSADVWSSGVWFGAQLRPWLAAGTGFRLLKSDDYGVEQLSFDLEVLARHTVDDLHGAQWRSSAAVALRHAGSRGADDERVTGGAFERVSVHGSDPPTELAWSASLRAERDGWSVEGVAELAKAIYEEAPGEWKQHLGLEIGALDLAFLRGGYVNHFTYSGLCFGAGLRTPVQRGWSFGFDYSRTPDPWNEVDLGVLDGPPFLTEPEDTFSFTLSFTPVS